MKTRASDLATAFLVVTIVLAMVLAAFPAEETQPQFTEFYVLDADGDASGYPSTVSPGERFVVVLGVENHESARTTYRVSGSLGGDTVLSREIALDPEDGWHHRLSVVAPADPGRHPLRFRLYKNGADTPSQRLRLWVSVEDDPSEPLPEEDLGVLVSL